VAVLVRVLGSIGDPAAAVDAVGALLRPVGKLAVHEHLPDPDMIELAWLCRLVESRGFTLATVRRPHWNYAALFRRHARPVAAG
jgi:hypothetical protein